MANVVDQDQQWLLSCLSATLDPNQEVRSFAEASLDQASRQSGFGSALSKVVANKELAVGLRQLAAVLLKQLVKKHWQEGEDSFEPPVVSVDEKDIIRRMLLLTLDDPHRKICTAIGVAVASIAAYDWPEEWSDLLPFLLNLINNQTNLNGVHGAMKCLVLLSADLDDRMVPTLIPALFPSLLTIVSSPQIYDTYIRTKALSIVYSCTSMLGAMSGVYNAETSSLVVPLLKPWMEQFSSILQIPVQSENPDDWSIRMEVLKCLNQFIQNFSSLIKSEFEVILRPLWNTFVSSLRVYEQASIEGMEDSYEGRYDSDGSEISLESFVIQLFELLLTIVGNSRLGKVVAANVKELVYYTIAFLQMTEQQVHTWSADANQFIADEEDATYSCRISGVLLLEEVVNSFDGEGYLAVIDAAKQWFNESQTRKVAGNASWWRIREATLFALSSLSEQLLETQESGFQTSNLKTMIEQIVVEDFQIDSLEYPFLYARIFTSVAKFSSVISSEVLEHSLDAALKAITMNVPPPVKVGACRALAQLLPKAKKEIVQPQLFGLFSSLTDLLNHASDETLHMVLETLQEAVKAGYESPEIVEHVLSPVILNVWASHILDPFISIDALEVLEAIKSIPGCIHPLVSRILPYIGPILNKPQEQADGLVAGSLDLVTMLLKNAPGDVVKAVYDVCFDAAIRIILQSDEHSEIQNATECLCAFISGGRQEVLFWGPDSGSTMRSLLDIASRLLDPNLESSGSLFVGSYILQLILHLPSQMAVHIHDLVAALVRRMQSAQISSLRSSLLVVFARLVHMSVPNVGQFIDLLISIPAEGHNNSFAYVMSEWARQQGEIQGAYQIKVTTSALALLLNSKHSELEKTRVQGHLIKSATGITTRSKAKSTPDQWVMLPLPTKIVALLADALTEIQEQVLAGEDEDSDWEEVQTDGIDNDKEFLSSVSALGKPSYEHLEAMAKVFNEDQDDQYEDDLLYVADPLNQINVVNYLVDFFANFSQSDRQLLDHICKSLTQPQQNAIQMVLKR
ncbi:importin-9 [Trifolium pratense]|uniref:importin-9 n=1 Tax=Trifolium pratense TaxID=57577 RepID=UPI001E691D22|nr:importin-9 [Trifolium pratense]